MTLYAPADGVIAQRSVQVGTQDAPGTPLMAVVPHYSLWVDANFKEVQLADIRVGQPVTVTTDTYGSGTVFHGHVAGFSPGTGNAFALLPPQNATGNWIKIVQRLPVRIALDHPQELKDHPLRVGLSTTVSVDVSDTSGSLMRSTVKADLRDRTDETRKARSDAMIAQIIAANAGSSATDNTRVTQ
jgi:membrane fusion protein (multidrug efflux system)